MSIAPGILNLTFPQGATWDLSLTYVDGDGDPIDLTAHTARMQVRNSYTADPPVLSLASGTGITLGGTAGSHCKTKANITILYNKHERR
jgi:hypothetical protein